MYSYQRGALIHFHPPAFKLDYFPVIFDQSVLLLKMDDRHINDMNINTGITSCKETKKSKWSLLEHFLSSKTRTNIEKQQSSPATVTCLSILKQIFHQPSRSHSINVDYRTSILIY